jgi:hypothetical protein
VWERDAQRRVMFGHDVQKHANKNFARSNGVLYMLRNR